MDNERLLGEIYSTTQQTKDDIQKIKMHFEPPDGCIIKMLAKLQEHDSQLKLLRRGIVVMWTMIITFFASVGYFFLRHIGLGG